MFAFEEINIMPAPTIKTIRDLIFYQYAKIIAESAGIKKHRSGEYYRFIIDRVNKLRSGEINMSAITRELKMQMKAVEKECEYCQNTNDLSWDHIIPQIKGGPDTADNLVLCCKSCNSSKGKKGIYHWFGAENKDSLPRLIAGKYLKLLFDIHAERGTLDSLGLKGDAKLTVLDLEVY
jgi:hypothetical protein